MRIFEKPAFEALLLSAGGRAHYPGEEPNASVEEDQSADLAAREDVVADRDRDDGAGLEQALVDPLEAAAEDRDPGAGGELADEGLGERAAARGHGEERGFGALLQDMVDRRAEHVGAHHHPGAAPGWGIVHGAVFVGGEVADLGSLK
jgi:hypothetical protein